MNEQTNFDIDYEHMDDLPLLNRIEWNHAQLETNNSISDQVNMQTVLSIIKSLHAH